MTLFWKPKIAQVQELAMSELSPVELAFVSGGLETKTSSTSDPGKCADRCDGKKNADYNKCMKDCFKE